MNSFRIKILLFLLISINVFSQEKKPRKASDYIISLDNSRDSLYEVIMAGFEDYLDQNPDDLDVRIEQCEVIGNAFYDYYDDYNPLEDEYSECINELLLDFPENHRVLLYKLKNTWGDSAITIANRILDLNRADPGSWSHLELSLAYQSLANSYNYYGTAEQVIENAELAQALNDTIDLSYLIASKYKEKYQYKKAIEALTNNLDSTVSNQFKYSKGTLLLELGEENTAMELFEQVKDDTSIYVDHGAIAQALIANEKYFEARTYLLKDLEAAYQRSPALHSLFEYDYQHSSTDTLLSTYNQLMDETVHNDTFGLYRLLVSLKAPFKAWRWNDLLKLISFALLLLAIFVAPYLIVLPIDFISRRFNLNNKTPALKSSTWDLADLWLIFSFVVLVDIMVLLIFDYPWLLTSFFNEMYIEEGSVMSRDVAYESIVFFLLLLVLTLGYLKKADYQFLKSNDWRIGKSIGFGIVFALIYRSFYFSLVNAGLLPGIETAMLNGAVDSVMSISQYYHPLIAFLFVVIIVPFYEEYIFRGIILNSIDRRIKFTAANVIQSFLFALVHDNFNLFPFYFFVAIIAGYMVKRSNSLVPALTFHATNNVLAFIAISIT